MDKNGLAKVFYFSVALILLASALLKLYSIFTDPFYELSLIYPVSIGFLISAIEILAAYFILLANSLRLRKYLVASLFTCFCLFDCYLVFQGIQFCGCAGFVQIPTWLSLSICIVIAFSAAVIPFDFEGRLVPIGISEEAAIGSHFGITSAIAIGCATYLIGGSFSGADSYLVVSFGEIEVDQTASKVVALNDVLEPSSTIYGGETSCQCVLFAIPKTSTGEAKAVHLFTTPHRLGALRQRVDLFISRGRLRIYVNANVIPNPLLLTGGIQ